MLISSFLSCVLLLVQGALCSDLRQEPSVNGKVKQLATDSDTYEYNHPPIPESNGQQGLRKEKSISINEQNPPSRTRLRSVRRRVRPSTITTTSTSKPSTSTTNLEIPVQVIYDTTPTAVRSHSRKSTNRPLDKLQGRQVQPIRNKKIDIRQTLNETNSVDLADVTGSATTFTDKNDVSSTTEYPKRSRGSYFKKRTENPPPKVKIVEEKNFVFAHSGNFHYSFLDGDGTKVSSQGSLRSYDNNKTGEAVSGSVYYKDKDGNDYNLSYTADENGYRPIGAHLPTPPPLPPAIARALKYIADKSTSPPPDKIE